MQVGALLLAQQRAQGAVQRACLRRQPRQHRLQRPRLPRRQLLRQTLG